jgi:hypothetical protein
MDGRIDSTDWVGRALREVQKVAVRTLFLCFVAPALTGSPGRPAAPARAASGLESDQLPGAIFPAHRVVGFYGNPLSAGMGILGKLPPDEMLERLRAQARAWERADPSIAVLPALHLVAVVAQPHPGKDGRYRARTDSATVARVAEWAEGCGCLLFVDLQIGRSTVRDEVRAFLPLLRRPYVHLALDPEFAVGPHGVPGRVIGSLDASDINHAIDELTRVVREERIPPKVLVVHRFTERMVTNRTSIRPNPSVQIVIDMDGFGHPRLKRSSYDAYVGSQVVQYTGFKLFYELDRPLMSERDVLGLRPIPLFILYQ